MKRGDRLVWKPSLEPWTWVYLEVKRVAKDGSWADLSCSTWAAMWTRRQPLPLPRTIYALPWGQSDFDAQEKDHDRMLAAKS